jgi:hypothetical protein
MRQPIRPQPMITSRLFGSASASGSEKRAFVIPASQHYIASPHRLLTSLTLSPYHVFRNPDKGEKQ